MQGQMMNLPLMVSSIIEHADRYHGDTEIVSRTVEGSIHRYNYSQAHQRARQLANALSQLGTTQGDRVGTLAWNGYRHFEIYYGVSGMGAVTHTINPRLFPEQISWIINHAEDRIVFFDITFSSLVETLAQQCPNVEHWVAMTEQANMPDLHIANLLCYEKLLEAESPDFTWPRLDENSAAALCYTSGTTGNPKGVLYSHRSTLLHALSSLQPDAFNLASRDVVLPVVPMFHVNAWGLPYAAPLTGAKLVMPGPAQDGESLYDLFESEKVTFTAGVPTVWLGLLQHLQKTSSQLSTVERMIVGGSACPPSLMQCFDKEHGIKIVHAWGMTEMSPLGTINAPKKAHLTLSAEQQFAIAVKQGRPPFGVDLKIVDDTGKELPRDGKTTGDLRVRGHWVIEQYYRKSDSPLIDDWFPTGDVANLDQDGFMEITDRSKDVIKSGGEWISSIELENIAMNHPAVAEAAALGVPHPKWDERPVLVAVIKPGQTLTRHELLTEFTDKVAKFCIPDDVIFVDDIPHTATGKISKLQLRDQLAGYSWDELGNRLGGAK